MSTEQQRQRISALVDGELGRFEAAAAINDLTRSPELAASWERWHLIGRALRGEPNTLAARATAARVRAAADAQHLSGRGRRPPRSRRPGAWQPIGGAIAAGLMVVGLALFLTKPVSQQQGGIHGFAGTPAPLPAQPVAERWQQADPVVRARLDRLLVNHQEQVAGLGSPGVAAYAAVIGYERLP
ncbi:MAG: sigma-E factor negative regulatory protein [Thiohalocapsa sp.]|jgi:sigma-E factor negative regulatory protein RseA|uniref:sigma-E factor negative regulatory protein n=1 Tax=Thiohalocapsa sp. TaxID=2497641 RepID=UPI0025F97FA1|nr:sigma-E factor negative regulatory protein [Thiohalocapsa sp.]MCG6939777.1 sigma-E factor negative regulatory protein [Thiohalocapsa sp.]